MKLCRRKYALFSVFLVACGGGSGTGSEDGSVSSDTIEQDISRVDAGGTDVSSADVSSVDVVQNDTVVSMDVMGGDSAGPVGQTLASPMPMITRFDSSRVQTTPARTIRAMGEQLAWGVTAHSSGRVVLLSQTTGASGTELDGTFRFENPFGTMEQELVLTPVMGTNVVGADSIRAAVFDGPDVLYATGELTGDLGLNDQLSGPDNDGMLVKLERVNGRWTIAWRLQVATGQPDELVGLNLYRDARTNEVTLYAVGSTRCRTVDNVTCAAGDILRGLTNDLLVLAVGTDGRIKHRAVVGLPNSFEELMTVHATEQGVFVGGTTNGDLGSRFMRSTHDGAPASTDDYEAFVARFSLDLATRHWFHSFGGPTRDMTQDLEVRAGTIYVAGDAESLDPMEDVRLPCDDPRANPRAAPNDISVRAFSLDASGTLTRELWSSVYSTPAADTGQGIAIGQDNTGVDRVWVVGAVGGSGDHCDYRPPSLDGVLLAYPLTGGAPVLERRIDTDGMRPDYLMDVYAASDTHRVYFIGSVAGGANAQGNPVDWDLLTGCLGCR